MAKIHLGLVATACGILFVAVCLYFDRRRHKDPHFRKKLRLRREKKLAEKLKKIEEAKPPPTADPKEQQCMLIFEIQRAEDEMSIGQHDTAIIHFANAISICADPEKLLKALQRSLPSETFDNLLHLLSSNYGRKFSKFQNSRAVRKTSSPRKVR